MSSRLRCSCVRASLAATLLFSWQESVRGPARNLLFRLPNRCTITRIFLFASFVTTLAKFIRVLRKVHAPAHGGGHTAGAVGQTRVEARLPPSLHTFSREKMGELVFLITLAFTEAGNEGRPVLVID